MKKPSLTAFAVLLISTSLFAANQVLIVPDEFPAMEHVAAKLKSEENISSKLVWQTNLPPDLSPFPAVIVYIHEDLKPMAEKAFINTQAGGKPITSSLISSGKRKNKDWFNFLGILSEEIRDAGGYKWTKALRRTRQPARRPSRRTVVFHSERVAFKAASDTKDAACRSA